MAERRWREPRWRCGEPDCPQRARQRVDVAGEWDPIDAALAELEAHYRRAHPAVADDLKVVVDDEQLAA